MQFPSTMQQQVLTAVRLSIIIPLKDKGPFVARCIDSVIAAQSRSPEGCEIIVVDNGSRDGGREIVAERQSLGIRVVDSAATTIGGVRNLGAAQATGAILWFLDADCVVEPDHILTLRGLFEDPELIASGCRVKYPLDHSWVERTWHLLHYRPSDGLRKYINSGNLVVRSDAFKKVGGFSETMVTGEDADLGNRLREAGVTSVERQALVVTHLDNPRSLSEFFTKEIWHAHGSATDLRAGKLDLVTVSAILHLVCWLAALVSSLWFLFHPGWPAATLAVLLPWLVPALTLAFRVLQVRRIVNIPQALLLYQVYFLARGRSLVTAG